MWESNCWGQLVRLSHQVRDESQFPQFPFLLRISEWNNPSIIMRQGSVGGRGLRIPLFLLLPCQEPPFPIYFPLQLSLPFRLIAWVNCLAKVGQITSGGFSVVPYYRYYIQWVLKPLWCVCLIISIIFELWKCNIENNLMKLKLMYLFNNSKVIIMCNHKVNFKT